MNTAPGSENSEIERAIRQAIELRAKALWQMLGIELVDHRVIIHGCVGSYYHKQIVLQAVLDVVGSAGASGIELDIQVVRGTTPSDT